MWPGVTTGFGILEWGFTGKPKYKMRNICPVRIDIIPHIYSSFNENLLNVYVWMAEI